jgi:hypothetical protein
MTRDNVARFDETCEQHVSILRLFHEAGGKYSKDPQLYDILEIRDTNLPRLFEIFAAAERQRCAQIAREFDRDHPNTNYGGFIARLIEETAP